MAHAETQKLTQDDAQRAALAELNANTLAEEEKAEKRKTKQGNACMISQLHDLAEAVLAKKSGESNDEQILPLEDSRGQYNPNSDLMSDLEDNSVNVGVLGGGDPKVLKSGDNSDPSASNDPTSNDAPSDPYSNTGLAKAIQEKIKALLGELKKNPFADVTMGISEVFQMIQQFGGNVVGQDAQAQQAMTDFIGTSSYVQNLLADKDGTPQYDVNPYTGEIEKDKPKVSPEQALSDALKSIKSRMNSPYVLDKDGNPTKTPNYLYNFFHDPKAPNNQALANNIETNMEGIAKALGNDSTSDPIDIPKDSIKNMWQKATPQPSASGKPAPQPDPTTLQAVQTAMGDFANTLTSSSSAVQALAKSDTQTYTAEQGNFNKFLQAQISQEKSFVANQKSNG